jgi:hypothetical protein
VIANGGYHPDIICDPVEAVVRRESFYSPWILQSGSLFAMNEKPGKEVNCDAFFSNDYWIREYEAVELFILL